MTTERSDLIARLRQKAHRWTSMRQTGFSLLEEAADALSTQAEEIERLTKERDEAREQLKKCTKHPPEILDAAAMEKAAKDFCTSIGVSPDFRWDGIYNWQYVQFGSNLENANYLQYWREESADQEERADKAETERDALKADVARLTHERNVAFKYGAMEMREELANTYERGGNSYMANEIRDALLPKQATSPRAEIDQLKAARAAARREALEEAATACRPHRDDDAMDRQAKAECEAAIRALLGDEEG